MFEICFLLTGLFLFFYVLVNSKEINIVFPILIIGYTIFLALFKFIQFEIIDIYLLIIYFIAILISLYNFVLGYTILIHLKLLSDFKIGSRKYR